jgi:hypothetical protein
MAVPCAAPFPLTARIAGRHRLVGTRAPGRGRALDTTLTVVARMGSLITLAALLVLGGAVGGLLDVPPSNPTLTVTYDGR